MSLASALRATAVLVAAGLVLAAFGGLTQADAKSGKGKAAGRQKVMLCHKGKRTIRVGAPALRAHLRHGDQPGACFGQTNVTPGPNEAVLVVFKYVINDNGGTKAPAAFTLTINGEAVVGGNSFSGSSAGTAKVILGSGSYSVTENTVPGYSLASTSLGCSGTISPGQEKTCLLVNDDVRP
jgi:Prealbumin-like fold domain